MADKKEIAKDIGLSLLVPPFGASVLALKKALKKHRESKDKKEKARLQKLIDDLKSEIKLKKGDRGAAEAMPKKKFDMKKGGTVSKYSKGGGVRSSKYKL
jgi:hypothetical protein